jgi:hypothetical protein
VKAFANVSDAQALFGQLKSEILSQQINDHVQLVCNQPIIGFLCHHDSLLRFLEILYDPIDAVHVDANDLPDLLLRNPSQAQLDDH